MGLGASGAPATYHRRMRRAPSAAIDLAVVVVFVIVGRQTHDEGNAMAAAALTAAPFIIALAAGWLLSSFVRATTPLIEGGLIALITAGAGTFLRRVVFDEGIAFPFVLVTTGFLAAGMIGWRLLRTARSWSRIPPADTPTASR